MKEYTAPNIELTVIEQSDVIATSLGDDTFFDTPIGDLEAWEW